MTKKNIDETLAKRLTAVCERFGIDVAFTAEDAAKIREAHERMVSQAQLGRLIAARPELRLLAESVAGTRSVSAKQLSEMSDDDFLSRLALVSEAGARIHDPRHTSALRERPTQGLPRPQRVEPLRRAPSETRADALAAGDGDSLMQRLVEKTLQTRRQR